MQYEYRDEVLYQQLNAVDYAKAVINRIDDEIEQEGRVFAINLLNRVMEGLDVDNAVTEFKGHIFTVLQNISQGIFLRQNYKENQKEEAKNIAQTI